MSESDAALRNCLNPEQLSDFTLPVQAILNRCPASHLSQIYKIPNFTDVHDFLRNIAIKRGKMKQVRSLCFAHFLPNFQGRCCGY